jgi:hypothetical protein
MFAPIGGFQLNLKLAVEETSDAGTQLDMQS